MIVIVGASRGLGRELSKVLNNENLLLMSKSKIETNNKNHHFISANINNLNFSEIDPFLKNEKIDAVFFTVGLVNERDNFNLNEEDKTEIVKTNFLSVARLTEYFLNSGKLNKNSLICFCSSATTVLPRNKQVMYCASKNALNSYYQSLKTFIESKKLKIRSALLILGYLDTSMNEKIKTIFPKKDVNQLAKIILKKMNKLDGVYYIPFYWFLIKLMINFLPLKIKIKIINFLNI